MRPLPRGGGRPARGRELLRPPRPSPRRRSCASASWPPSWRCPGAQDVALAAPGAPLRTAVLAAAASPPSPGRGRPRAASGQPGDHARSRVPNTEMTRTVRPPARHLGELRSAATRRWRRGGGARARPPRHHARRARAASSTALRDVCPSSRRRSITSMLFVRPGDSPGSAPTGVLGRTFHPAYKPRPRPRTRLLRRRQFRATAAPFAGRHPRAPRR
jgi:hypothetical protein